MVSTPMNPTVQNDHVSGVAAGKLAAGDGTFVLFHGGKGITGELGPASAGRALGRLQGTFGQSTPSPIGPFVGPIHRRSTRRPTELPSSDDVCVEVLDALLPVGSGIEDDAVTV